MPTLRITGNDDFMLTGAALDQRYSVPGSEHIIVPGRHFAPLSKENRLLVINAISKFILSPMEPVLVTT